MEENHEEKRLILIIGGTNFMGKYLIEKLASNPKNEVHGINRKKLHW